MALSASYSCKPAAAFRNFPPAPHHANRHSQTMRANPWLAYYPTATEETAALYSKDLQNGLTQSRIPPSPTQIHSPTYIKQALATAPNHPLPLPGCYPHTGSPSHPAKPATRRTATVPPAPAPPLCPWNCGSERRHIGTAYSWPPLRFNMHFSLAPPPHCNFLQPDGRGSRASSSI